MIKMPQGTFKMVNDKIRADNIYAITYESGDWRDMIPYDEMEIFTDELEYISRLRELESNYSEGISKVRKWILNQEWISVE